MSSFGWGGSTPECAIGHANPWESDEPPPLEDCPECCGLDVELYWRDDTKICKDCQIVFNMWTGSTVIDREELELGDEPA